MKLALCCLVITTLVVLALCEPEPELEPQQGLLGDVDFAPRFKRNPQAGHRRDAKRSRLGLHRVRWDYNPRRGG